MKYKKKVIAELEKCYSIAPLSYLGESCFLVASETRDRCLLFDCEGNLKETVWEGPGGVMSMEQLPGADGLFLATQRFYSPNDSAGAEIVMAVPKGGTWEVRTVAKLPFVHRFGILKSGEKNYLLAATLKSAHAFEDDWTCPGRVWAAELPRDLSAINGDSPLILEPILSGLYKNHGFCKCGGAERQFALIGAENGVFKLTPPSENNSRWLTERLLDSPASDMALADLDGDGLDEMIVFSPFHGENLSIYKIIDGNYRKVYAFPEKLAFLHAIWAGKLNGNATVLIGHREGARELLSLTLSGKYRLEILDRNVGPANVFVLGGGENDIIISANREINEVALYCPR